MRRLLFVFLFLAVVGLYAAFLYGTRAPDAPDAEAAAPVDPGVGANPVAPEKRNAVLSQPVREERGVGIVRGKVTSNGQPVAGATVTATRAEADESLSELVCHCDNVCGRKLLECGCGEAAEQLKELVADRRGEVVPVGRTVTGADGTFELTHLEPGSLGLWADSTTLGTALVQPVAVDGPDVAIALGSGLTLKGKVTLDGKPVTSGAWVTAIHGEQSRFFDVLVQSDGTFSVGPLPLGMYSLVAGAPGALPGHDHVRKDSKADEIALELFSPRTLTGRVEADGKPLGGVTVKLDGNHHKAEMVTLSDGTFRFTSLRPGEQELTATKGNLRGDLTAKVPKTGIAKEVVLTLAESARLMGIVRAEGVPVPKARVHVYSMDHEARTETDADGRFDFSVPSGKGANVYVSATGYVQWRDHVDLVSGKSADVTVNLERSVAISGRVVDPDGQPVDGARIKAFLDTPLDGGESDELAEMRREYDTTTERATSFDGGLFVLSDLRHGRYALTADHSDFVSTQASALAPTAGLELKLKDGLSLDGVVVGPDGKPAIAKIDVWAKRPFSTHSSTSGADGVFRIRGLVEGEAQVHASNEQGQVTEPVQIGRGKNTVRLALEKSLSLSGTVVSTDGAPVADVRVFARGATSSYGGDDSDESGAFEIKRLKPGKHDLEVTGRDRDPASAWTLAAPVSAEAGATGVTVVVKRATLVRGRVVDEKRTPIVAFQVNSEDFEADDGRFELALRGAQRTITISAEGFASLRQTVKPEGGDLGDIVLGGRTLRVRAMSSGSPVERAEVWLEDVWKGGGRGTPIGLTGADGWTTVRGIPPTNARLVVNHTRFRPTTVAVADGENERVVALDAGATLVVKVLDAKGAPARGAVSVWLAEAPGPTLRTDAQGQVKMEGMPAGKAFVLARTSARDRASASVELPEAGVREVTLAVKAETLSAKVEVTGAPSGWKPMAVGFASADLPAPVTRDDFQRLATVSNTQDASRPLAASPGRWHAIIWLAGEGERIGLFTVTVTLTEGMQKLSVQVPPTFLEVASDEL